MRNNLIIARPTTLAAAHRLSDSGGHECMMCMKPFFSHGPSNCEVAVIGSGILMILTAILFLVGPK
jgi:hypothetical protein